MKKKSGFVFLSGIRYPVSAIAIAFAISSCSVRQQTVAPPSVVSTQASFDGNVANSGLIAPDGQGGFYVTPHFIERYDALLAKYGDRLSPPVAVGDRRGINGPLPSPSPVSGIRFPVSEIPREFRVTSEMIARFRTMNLWRKADQPP